MKRAIVRRDGPISYERSLSLKEKKLRQAHGRGYGKRWQRESKMFLRAHPLCEECKKNGRFVQATVVDHIVPHRGDMKLFWDQSN